MDVLVYPNPTKGMLNIQLPYSEEEQTIIIRNIQGAIVYSETIVTSTTHRINIETIASGIYLLEVNNGINHFTQKIVKQ